MIRGVIDLIVNDATSAGLIGSSGSVVKVFPVVAEQETNKPYVLLRRTGELPSVVKQSVSELDVVTFNVTAYAIKYKTCIDILNAIRLAIDNFQGTSQTIVFKRILYNNSQDLFDQADNSFVIVDTYQARIQR